MKYLFWFGLLYYLVRVWVPSDLENLRAIPYVLVVMLISGILLQGEANDYSEDCYQLPNDRTY